MLSSSSSGGFNSSAAANFQSDPAGSVLPRVEPQLATVQPPLRCERECACLRMVRHGETGGGRCLGLWFVC